MNLEMKLKILHDITREMSSATDFVEKECVLKESALALFYVHSEEIKGRFSKFVKELNQPLTPFQEKIIAMYATEK